MHFLIEWRWATWVLYFKKEGDRLWRKMHIIHYSFPLFEEASWKTYSYARIISMVIKILMRKMSDKVLASSIRKCYFFTLPKKACRTYKEQIFILRVFRDYRIASNNLTGAYFNTGLNAFEVQVNSQKKKDLKNLEILSN